MTPSFLLLSVQIGLSVVLAGLALHDWRGGRVPNKVTLPLLLLSLGFVLGRLWVARRFTADIGLVGLCWLVCLGMWKLKMFGSGDMKLVMALIGFFPDLKLIYLLLGVLGVGLLIIFATRYGRQGFRRLAAIVFTIFNGSLPTPADLQEAYEQRSSRVTFLISLAGMLYVWLLPWFVGL